MTECSCSIVFFNTKQDIAEKTIKKLCICDEITAIFIVDNGNTIDYGGIKEICYKSSKELFIEKTENNGLSVAQNTVINEKKLSTYHLILNPDIFIESNTLKTLLNYFKSNNDVAVLGPKIKLPSEEIYPSAKLIPDPITQILRRLNPSGKSNQEYELHGINFKQPTAVPMISGCFILTKSVYLKNIKGFDERFFLYFEDIDLLMRLKEFGNIYYHPGAEVIHLHSDASRKSLRMMLYHITSFIKYYFKWNWLLSREHARENSDLLDKIK